VTSSRIIYTARCLVVMLEVVYVRQGDARARVPIIMLSVGDSCVGVFMENFNLLSSQDMTEATPAGCLAAVI
jgi:hypothetical protein